jgi:hypothetical protein
MIEEGKKELKIINKEETLVIKILAVLMEASILAEEVISILMMYLNNNFNIKSPK